MAGMSEQEALAALHQVYTTYVELLSERASAAEFQASKRLRWRGIDALLFLSEKFLGPRKPGELPMLCNGCHLRRARQQDGHQAFCDGCLNASTEDRPRSVAPESAPISPFGER
jgi:hypothetical protein